MSRRGHPLFLAIFLLILAPLAAVVVVAVLLLFGAKPSLVFAPGFAIRSLLASWGLHIANRVGVAGTVALWWMLFAGIGLAWDRRRSPTARPSSPARPRRGA